MFALSTSVVGFQLQAPSQPLLQCKPIQNRPAISMLDDDESSSTLDRLSSLKGEVEGKQEEAAAEPATKSLFDLVDELSGSPAPAAKEVEAPVPAAQEAPAPAARRERPSRDTAAPREKLSLPSVPPVLALEVAAGVALAVVTQRQKKMNAAAKEQVEEIRKQAEELEASVAADLAELAELREDYGDVEDTKPLFADPRVAAVAGGACRRDRKRAATQPTPDRQPSRSHRVDRSVSFPGGTRVLETTCDLEP